MCVDEHEATHRAYMTAYIRNDIEYFSSRRGGYVHGESFRAKDDPRVTRVGRVLRKLSLDELPQLLNVLRGEMSIVGPRPPMPYEVDLYDDAQLQRLTATVGVTGWSQVNGRCTIGFDDLVRLDVEYARRQSFLFDLWILLRTVPAVLSRKGAD
jgi:lipopolysaccharide/colanic/teichoic acid biosynthesis glycosyltransferase